MILVPQRGKVIFVEGEHPRDQPVLGIDSVGKAVVVRLGGDLDLYNADGVRSALAGVIDGSPSRVVVDAAEVEFIDSTALGVLVDAHRKLAGGLRIARPQDPIRRALQVSGIDRHLTVHDSVDDALTG
jgi:anti-sigma B factor antagonist